MRLIPPAVLVTEPPLTKAETFAPSVALANEPAMLTDGAERDAHVVATDLACSVAVALTEVAVTAAELIDACVVGLTVTFAIEPAAAKPSNAMATATEWTVAVACEVSVASSCSAPPSVSVPPET